VNSAMPEVVVEMVARALSDRRRAVRGASVLVCGVAYKRDVDDVRESPALDVISLLQGRGAQVAYADPLVPELRIAGAAITRVPIEDAGRFDCVVITTDHTGVDYGALADRAPLIVDTRNATRAVRQAYAHKIVAL
jgi:UDP-N-acetyl-D-glucosamine dehydrogenase